MPLFKRRPNPAIAASKVGQGIAYDDKSQLWILGQRAKPHGITYEQITATYLAAKPLLPHWFNDAAGDPERYVYVEASHAGALMGDPRVAFYLSPWTSRPDLGPEIDWIASDREHPILIDGDEFQVIVGAPYQDGNCLRFCMYRGADLPYYGQSFPLVD